MEEEAVRLNVPQEVRGGVLETLALALNERNRDNKKTKFGFSTSEDALTWNLFRSLQEAGRLRDVARLVTGQEHLDEPILYLWGLCLEEDTLERAIARELA